MKCPICRRESVDDSFFCRYCGKKLLSRCPSCGEKTAIYCQNCGVITLPSIYVDLGLPSGTLWKYKDESGFYTYDLAVSCFRDNLPSKEEWEELRSECEWSWTNSGYKVTGPNGKFIYMSAAGCHKASGNVNDVGSRGYYWSSTPFGSGYAWCLIFDSDRVYMNDYYRSGGLCVRLVQKK